MSLQELAFAALDARAALVTAMAEVAASTAAATAATDHAAVVQAQINNALQGNYSGARDALIAALAV